MNPTSERPDPLVGTTVAERYRIERLLGSGGMGAVYRAEHVHMRKTVALKVLHKELAGVNEVVARFEREAIAAGRIEHPNVAPATDFGKLDDGSFYLVLEYVDGKSLRELIAEGALGWERAVAIARQVVSALIAAHAAGIVHRDLKPDNVMLVQLADGSERVKVLDFGIARLTMSDAPRDATHLTKVGVVMGTVTYMSPEQALGQEVDERTDLYAVGVILHEMISGKLPFDADTAAQILAKQITEAPPPLPPSVPPALARLVDELLKKTAVERPPSARAVLERLDGIASASMPPPRTVLAAAPASSPSRRRTLMIGVAAAATVVGLGLAIALSGGEEKPVTKEKLEEAPATTANSLAVPAKASSKPAETAAEVKVTPEVTSADAGVAEEPSPASSGATSTTQNAPASKSTSKKRTQTTSDGSKKKKGPGGIYIPPPSQWF